MTRARKVCGMIEWKLAEVIGSVLVGAVPFCVGALKDQFGLGLIGLFTAVICTKFLGLWISVPVSAVFVAAVLLKSGEAPPKPRT